MQKNILYVLTLFLFAFPYTLLAAPNISVAPLVIDLDVQPRDLITKDITITNTGTQPVTVFPSVNNIDMDDGGKITNFVSRVMSDATASLAAWVEISRSGHLVPKGESITIPVTFRIHPTPKPGVYHAFVGFGWGTTVVDANRMVNEGRAPGVITTVTYAKESHQILRLGRFIVDRFITSNNNEGLHYTVNNPGDEPLAPDGEIIFYNNRGVEVAAIPVNPGREIIAPGESRQYTTPVPADGLLGKYKAFLNVEYGNAQLASVQDTAFFYVFPIKTLGGILMILLVVVTLIALFVHRRYLHEDVDDDEAIAHVPLRVRVKDSDPMEHDIDLKQK